MPRSSRRFTCLSFGLLLTLGGCAQVRDDGVGPTPPVGDAAVLPRDGEVPQCGSPVDCGDNNPCTDDGCVDGACTHTPMPADSPCRDNDLCNGDEACDGAGACRPGTPVDCAPSGPCVTSACDAGTGACVEAPMADCCLDDTACPASDACHPSHCRPDTHVCEAVALDQCCLADTDCPAGTCETAHCNPESHICEVQPVADCCTADAQCQAGTCQSAACNPTTHACEQLPLEGCCLHDAECPAAPCERPVCDGNTHACGGDRQPGCCVVDGDCAVGEACDPTAHVCYRQPVGCCALDSDCGVPDGCFVPRCGGPDACCVLDRLPGCCEVDADCDLTTRCDVRTLGCVPRGIEFAAVDAPAMPVSICAGTRTPDLAAEVYAVARTPGPGQGPGIDAEIGYGPVGTPPTDPSWTFTPGAYAGDVRNGFGALNNDLYNGQLMLPAEGDVEIAWRFRFDGGAWIYADLAPGGSTDGYESATALAAQVRACPPVPIGFAAFQHPLETITLCAGQDSELIFGRIWVDGVTPGVGQGENITAELGYGVAGSLPDDPANPPNPAAVPWVWTQAVYNGDLVNIFGELNDDEYRAVLAAVPEGTWDLAWRFHTLGGGVALGDLPPEGSSDGYRSVTTLHMQVEAICP